jgi:predicted ribonuclease YlaK
MNNPMLTIRTLSVSRELIDRVHQEGQTFINESAPVNAYAVLRNELDPKHTAFVYHIGGNIWRKIRANNQLNMHGLQPRDAKQNAFANSLVDPEVLISIAIGEAGTGKTTLALAYALDQYVSRRAPIILSKPASMVGEGKAFGPVPGDVDEKYAPYLASYEIALRRILGKSHGKGYFKMMMQKGDVQYVPIELVRGSEFADCTFILDEAQNLSWHELKSLISRMGSNTKMIILGDLEQIDTGATKRQTGLYQLLNSAPFKSSRVGAAIELDTQYRSAITALVADVDKWIKRGGTNSDLPF